MQTNNLPALMVVVFLILSSNSSFAGNAEISPSAIRQGKSFSVKLASLEGVARVEALFLGQKTALYPVGGGVFRGIFGVSPEQKPGEYELLLKVFRDNGREEEKPQLIAIKKNKFPIVSFWLKPAKKKLLAKDLIAAEWARIEKVLLNEDPGQKWNGRFALPAAGRISMAFGTKEYVNRRPRGQHRGLDIAVPAGTPVMAAESGRVVFAEKLKAFGGTLVIDHGQGIHTLYFHLSKFLKTMGTDVSEGERIALSGNSGISTGPHLHWGMSVHNVRVDPLQWTKNAF